MRKIVEIRFTDRAAGDGDSLGNRIGGPVRATARIDGGGAIEMDADSAGIPRKGVIVVIEAIPTGIKRSAIAARGRRRRAELLFFGIAQNRQPDFASELFRLINVPVSRAV